MPECERVLIVDDEEPIREVLSSLLETQGYECCTAPTAVVALRMIDAEPTRFQLVLSDIMMPEMTGVVFLEHLQQRHPDLPVLMLSALHDISIALDAIRKGAYDYMVKPFEKEDLFLAVRHALERRRLIEENRRYQLHLEELVAERTQQLQNTLAQLEKSYDYTLEALGGALDLKDSGTEGHSKRVTAFTIVIAGAMGISGPPLQTIARGAYLHDIGKIAVPDAILRKPGPLTDEEREAMRKHCEFGWQMLRRISFLDEVSEIVYSHQECYDGNGYPRGLKGIEIHLGARIFSVADALDAMLSDRPYRAALPLSRALEELRRMAGTQFDPEVVQAVLSQPSDLWPQLATQVGPGYGFAVKATGSA